MDIQDTFYYNECRENSMQKEVHGMGKYEFDPELKKFEKTSVPIVPAVVPLIQKMMDAMPATGSCN